MAKTLKTSCRLMTKVYFSVLFFYSRHRSQPLRNFRQEPKDFPDENKTKYLSSYCVRSSSLFCNFVLILLIRQRLGRKKFKMCS